MNKFLRMKIKEIYFMIKINKIQKNLFKNTKFSS